MTSKFLKNNTIILIYSVTLLSMFIFVKTVNPIVNYVRYAYVAFMGAYVVLKQKKFLFNKSLLAVVIFLVGHALLFGLIIVPGELSDIISDNAKNVFFFWGFVVFTAQYVWMNGAEKQFLIASQIVTTLFMNYCYITNFNGIAPIKFLPQLFGESIQRIRFTFGLSATNRAAYIALASFILSVMVWRECFKGKKLLSFRWTMPEIYVFVSGLISVLVMLSTQTRGALLSAVLFFVLTEVMNRSDEWKLNPKKIDWKIYCIFIFVLIGICAYFVLFNIDSRSEYLTTNLNVFMNHANKLVGMGYVPFNGFLTKVFEYETSPVDCYYLYIICTTGIIGAIMTFLPLLFILFRGIKQFCSNLTDALQNQYIGLYIVCIFTAFSESSFIAPYSPYSYTYWIMFFLFLLGRNKEQQKKLSYEGEAEIGQS